MIGIISVMARIFVIFFGIALIAIIVIISNINRIFNTSVLDDRPIQTDPEVTKKKHISGIVVPHHDLVKEKRQALFEKITKEIEQPETIILASPNHFELGNSPIQTTQKTWQLSNGTIEPNRELIDTLVNAKVADESDNFHNEHGILLLLGDIKHYFPNVAIVPLIFRLNTTAESIEQLNQLLYKNCSHCLLVASVDFSHYQPALLANLHDDLAVRYLRAHDSKNLLKKTEVDAPAVLALTAEWAITQKTEKFVLDEHTNSGVIANSPDTETTTHVFGWYEEGEQSESEENVTFIIGGDMMFDRLIAHTFLKDGLWKALDQLGNRVFWGTDASMVNLEGPISDVSVPDNTSPDYLVFNFPPETIEALKYFHVNAASLANNHSYNAGAKGLETTRKLLQDANIQSFGGPEEAIDAEFVGLFQGQTLKMYVIGVLGLSQNPDINQKIIELKKDPHARVLIFPHWGSEYAKTHSKSQETMAHAWIDAGADVVIGAHPHVIQDAGIYRGKPIIYSIGNLLFDQMFSTETQLGLLIVGKFTPEHLEWFALPVESRKLKPQLMHGSTKQEIINQLYLPFNDYLQATPSGQKIVMPN